jgi:Uncharacterized conserved protein
MIVHTFQNELMIRRPIAVVFDFFSQAENLQKLTPPWLHFRVLTPAPIELKQGAKIAYGLRVRGVPLKWLTEIEQWRPPFQFIDVQVSGPYKLWRHTHLFSEVERGTRMRDIVNYALPFGPLGRLANRLQVSRDLSKIFEYRTQRVNEILG